jgi:hypothetical protein
MQERFSRDLPIKVEDDQQFLGAHAGGAQEGEVWVREGWFELDPGVYFK